MKPLKNKVAEKAIKVIDLETFFPKRSQVIDFDIKQFLFKELILKEKEFRIQLNQLDTSIYSEKWAWIYCSNDAIIPNWAYMLVTSILKDVCKGIVFAENYNEAEEKVALKMINHIDLSDYENERILIKGCGNRKVSPEIYISIQQKLQETAKAISFGEACSTVPVYKKRRS